MDRGMSLSECGGDLECAHHLSAPAGAKRRLPALLALVFQICDLHHHSIHFIFLYEPAGSGATVNTNRKKIVRARAIVKCLDELNRKNHTNAIPEPLSPGECSSQG